MKRNSYVFFSILLSGFYLHAMDNNPSLTTYHVPAQNGVFHREFPLSAIHSIKAENELQDSGTIAGLIIRPKVEYRQMVASCKVTLTHIEGDKHQTALKDQEIHAVTLMRADVSSALGGMHIPGDNIHVEGLRIGKKHISPGDLLTVSEPGKKELIKAVFLATHMTHTCCSKLESRAGRLAYDFLNGEGTCENLIIKTPAGEILHGPDQRLRGLRLAPIKEGIISLGDDIFIERGPAKDQRLASLDMAAYAASILAKSIPAALSEQDKDAKRAAYRKAQFLKQQDTK